MIKKQATRIITAKIEAVADMKEGDRLTSKQRAVDYFLRELRYAFPGADHITVTEVQDFIFEQEEKTEREKLVDALTEGGFRPCTLSVDECMSKPELECHECVRKWVEKVAICKS